VEQLPIDVEQ